MNNTETFDEVAKAAARYQVELAAKKEAAESSTQMRANWQAELDRLKRTKTTCTILGFVTVGIIWYWAASVVFPNMELNELSAQIGFVLFAICGSLLYFCIPFGFCPIINFMKNNGFFAIGGWVFLVMLCVILLVFAVCIGPFYFFYLNSKIKTAKQNVEIAQQNEQITYAEYQAY